MKPAENSSFQSGTVNGHEYVDLGLSVKWATCNVGASSVSDYGDYYAWGETETKSNYDEDNSVMLGKDSGDISGNADYDAARANWGGAWRLPTEAEIRELVDKCQWEWTTIEGHSGYKVTGPNGNSIFLPAAGCRYGALLINAGKYGYYWISESYGDEKNAAYGLHFNSEDFDRSLDYRYYGSVVRPVSGMPGKNKVIIKEMNRINRVRKTEQKTKKRRCGRTVRRVTIRLPMITIKISAAHG